MSRWFFPIPGMPGFNGSGLEPWTELLWPELLWPDRVVRRGRQDRAMVGLQKARTANALAEPHSSGGGVLQRDHCSSSPARHANPEGDEAVLARPRPVQIGRASCRER